MKKSHSVNLVLITSLLIACNTSPNSKAKSRLYVRGDSTSHYNHVPYTHYGSHFYFRPYGFYSPGVGFRHAGYETPGFASKSAATSVSRGGFGRMGARVSS